MITGVSVSPFKKAYRKPAGKGLSSMGGHDGVSCMGSSMVSPRLSFSWMKTLASLSKDDSGGSKGETTMTSSMGFELGRDSATEFLARMIGMV